ncbi:MAG TPA: isochorismatase family cysteine hydrolase [Prolixibacteraceae bacterium]
MHEGILFWNVDTQIDFIEPTGKLYVKGAEKLKPALKKITNFAKENHIRVINTCDFHLINSNELSPNPDYITTFPEHCMAGTRGAEFIEETKPHLPAIVDWMTHLAILPQLANANQYRNIVIRKDAFDVFEGNPYTTRILNLIKPEKVFVYGVTTNVCVDKAVCGLAELGYKVFVFEDAIKELPTIPLPYKQWKKLGITMIGFDKIEKYL